jgi:hypothetical protein
MTPDDDNQLTILSAVRAYLAIEFENATISEVEESRTRNVIFHVRGPSGHHRLVVTELYRDRETGLDAAVNDLVEWQVAEMMRQSDGSVVVLETTGARVARE